jgi:hypothetical protein
MNNELKIQVIIKCVYGNDRIYPVCSKAKAFASIARQKTLDDAHINRIKELGYIVEVVQDIKTL